MGCLCWRCADAALRLHCDAHPTRMGKRIASHGLLSSSRATCCRYNDVDGVNTLTRRCQSLLPDVALRCVASRVLCASKWKQSICPDTNARTFELNSDVTHSHVC